jgi:uncharacterized protein YbaP (TraB family)
MKKIFLAVLALFLTQAQAQKLEKSLLWKISGNGITEVSYLYGTIHITCDATLPQKVKDAMNKTEQLYLELDMDDESMQMEMMGQIMMKEGVTMESLTSPEDYKIVDAFLTKNIGFPAKMVSTVKPFMVSAMLYPKMLDCPMQSIEGELMKIAKEQKEEIFGLETVAEQLNVFDAIPYQEQMNELVKTAKGDLKKDKEELDSMLVVYKSEDVDAMQKLTKESDNVLTSKYDDILLNNRNKNWIPKITTIAKAKPTFFGVGAAHLGGENGVINLLRKQGYKVEAVK